MRYLECDIRLLDITFGMKQCEYALSLMELANQKDPISVKKDEREPEKKDDNEPEKKDDNEPEKKDECEPEKKDDNEPEKKDDNEPEKKDDNEPEKNESKQKDENESEKKDEDEFKNKAEPESKEIDENESEKKDECESEKKPKQLIPNDQMIRVIHRIYKSESESLRNKLINETIQDVKPQPGALQTWYNWSIM